MTTRVLSLSNDDGCLRADVSYFLYCTRANVTMATATAKRGGSGHKCFETAVIIDSHIEISVVV